MGMLGVDLDKISLDDDNIFMKMILILLFMSDFLLGVIDLEKRKAFKELMPVASHPTRWWNSRMSEDEKKEVDPIFIDKVGKY